jgi:hypothetical protein
MHDGMGLDNDEWRLRVEARLSALQVMVSGLASASGKRSQLAGALESAARNPERCGSDLEFGAALREACLDIARDLRLQRKLKARDSA